MLGAYARGLARLELWTLDVRVSPLASQALARGLDGEARSNLLHHIDGLALAAAHRGRPDEIASARRLCALAKIWRHDSRTCATPVMRGPRGWTQYTSSSSAHTAIIASRSCFMNAS